MSDLDLKERLRAMYSHRGDGIPTQPVNPDGEEAADRIAALEDALVQEREENLWNAYHAGHAKDGQWTHMFMSDGEWLAKECGFNPLDGHYDDAAIRAAIPEAAKRVLEGDA